MLAESVPTCSGYQLCTGLKADQEAAYYASAHCVNVRGIISLINQMCLRPSNATLCACASGARNDLAASHLTSLDSARSAAEQQQRQLTVQQQYDSDT